MSDNRQPLVRRRQSTEIFETFNVLDHITGNGVFTGVPYEERPKNPLFPTYELAHTNQQLEIFKKYHARMVQERSDLYTLAEFHEECENAENSWREFRSKLPPPDKGRTMAIRAEIKMVTEALNYYENQWVRFQEDVKINANVSVAPANSFNCIPWPFFRAVSTVVRSTTRGFQPPDFPLEPEKAKEELEAFVYHDHRYRMYADKFVLKEAERRRWSQENYPELLRRVQPSDVGVVGAAYAYVVALLNGADDFKLEGCKQALAYFVEKWSERERLREEERLRRL
jgi:hypothetical protein